MAADLAISLATPFIEYLITPIRRQCGYILFYKRYLRELEEGASKLRDDLEGVEHKCEAARRNAMGIEKKVEKWIDSVNDAVKDADTTLARITSARTLILPHHLHFCFNQDTISEDDDELREPKSFFYLNPVICYKKGRKAKQTKLTIDQLNEERRDLGSDFAYEDLTRPIYSSKDYKPFTSRKKILKEIMDTLTHESVSVTGVWGMGGVGKSVLLKEVMRVSKEKNLFDDVAVATVSQDPDVKRIQGEIAFWLGLEFKDGDTVRARASRLHKRLRNNRKSTAEQQEKKQDVSHEEVRDALLPETKQDAISHEEVQDVVQNKEKEDAVLRKEKQDVVSARKKQDENVYGKVSRLLARSDKTSSAKLSMDHERQNHVETEEMDKNSNKDPERKPDVKQKQVLIILDDLWRGLDLEEVGIPQDAGAVKLLFTSRKHHVLSSEMGCYHQNIFKLKALVGNEPWMLFESIVGGKRLDASSIEIGKKVVEKCSGLPIVLKAIATTLKNQTLSEWRDALVQLSGSVDAYSNLELSFKHLESYEHKSLFLLCGLIGKARISLEDLFYYGAGLGLLKGDIKVRNALQRMKALVRSLQASSLLLEDDNQDRDHVKIHDVVREVAIRVASRDQHGLLITDGSELKEISREKLKNIKAISVRYANFRKLPGGWECPELKMFFLYRRQDDSPIDFPDSFFEGMRELKVLDLSGRCCDSLPSSLRFLENLSTLCLDRCSMMDLAIIGKISQLEILTFRGSKIERLPKEIGELTDLKVLNMSGCTKLEVIEPQVLANLTRLEELHMKGSSFNQWEDGGVVQPRNACISELNNMCNLSSINIHIHDVSKISEDLKFRNLVEYTVLIGDVWSWSPKYQESRTLKIKLDSCRISFLQENWLQDMLKRTQDLHLDGLKGRKKSIHELCSDGFQDLKHLHVQNSAGVQCVTRSSKWFPCTAFTLLESLVLENLTELKMISGGPLVVESLSKLKVIKVTSCGKLKSLFYCSMLKSLSQLEEIEVSDCEMMQEIVTVDSVATNIEVIPLQALCRIKFQKLPNLMRFCSNKLKVHHIERPRAEITSEDHCVPTNTLFFSEQPVSFPRLESLLLSSLPKLKSIWQDNSPTDQVVNLKCLEVESCKDLLTVIPSSLVTNLGNLERLMVRNCRSVEELFECGHADELALSGDVEIFPQLNTLGLYHLPLMRHIWPRHYRVQLRKVKVLQNLKLLDVGNCNSLRNVFPAAILKSLRQVAKIQVKNCEKIEEIISENTGDRGREITTIDDPAIFHSLVEISLENLVNMVAFVRVDQSIDLPSLKKLYVVKCPKMRAFSLPKTEQGDDGSLPLCFFDHKLLLPKVERLFLISLGSMKKIWHEKIPEQSFCKLEKLIVRDCQNLVDALPSKTVIGIGRSLQFQNIKEIIIRDCTSLEGSLFGFVWEGEGYKKSYSLPQLEILLLVNLPKLEHVLEPTSNVVLGFPNLVQISIKECQSLTDLFPIATTQTLSKLEKLQLLKCSSMRKVFGKEEAEEEEEMMDPILFPCLRSITAQRNDSLICFFSGISCALDFPSLEALQISWCPNLRTFLQSDTSERLELGLYNNGDRIHYLFDDDKVDWPKLKKMDLYQLSSVQEIWKNELPCLGRSDAVGLNVDSNIEILCELNELMLYDIPRLTHIGKVSVFQNLKSLKVTKCHSLKYLFPTAVLNSMRQITKISINNCEKLEEIISESTDTIEEYPIALLSLVDVRLGDLPNLVAFVRARRDRSINFPSFKELYVNKCPKMRAFSLPKTTDETLLLCFFDHKVLLPNLVRLDFVSAGRIGKIWHDDVSEESFCQLELLLIKDCHSLVNIFPSNMIGTQGFKFRSLKKISVRECNSLEGSLFEFSGEEKGQGCKKGYESLPQLENLWLYDLPNLEHVLEPVSPVVLGFPNLSYISIARCQSIIDLFPVATAPTLSKLEKLHIFRCSSLRQVFAKEEEDEMLSSISFPCLQSIKVQKLDSLICLFLGISCMLDFPSLEALDISLCPNLKTFVQRYTSDRLEELPSYISKSIHHLFDDKVLFPKLVQLDLESAGSVKKIWHEEISEDSFCKLEILNIKDCQDLVNIFPSNMIGLKFQSLKKISVDECNSLEGSLFEFMSDKQGQGCKNGYKSLPQLQYLGLFDLPKLEHVLEPTSHVVLGFPNLVEIVIADCESVIDLFPIATAPTLSKLEEIQIVRCESMRQVFGQDDEEEEDEMLNSIILFNCLRSVTIQNLGSLVSFFLGTNCVLDFPLLKELEISWCPNFNTFVQRLTSDSKDPLRHHLNKGIHCLFDEKVLFPNLVQLDLESVGSIDKIWHGDIPEESFCKLEIILVKDCQNLGKIFPSRMIGIHGFKFQCLKKISVSECNSVEGSLFEFSTDEEKGKFGCKKGRESLPQLEHLCLLNLPKLEHVLKPTSHVVLSFPNLVEIIIADCESLIDLFPIATTLTLSKLEEIQIVRCGSMRQVFGQDDEEEEDEMLNSIILFNRLRSVAIQNLGSLISFFLGTNCVLEFPLLKELEISCCPNLNTFVQRLTSDSEDQLPHHISKDIHCLFDEKVVFPNLVRLDLESVGNMDKIWHEEIPEESFCKLEIILVKDCQNLVNIFPSSMIGIHGFKFQCLKKISVSECNSLEGSLFEFSRDEETRKLGCKKGCESLPQLEHLCLLNLPKLEHVSEPTSHVVLSFPSLVEIIIADCESVIDLFPIATTLTLSKLEEIQIVRCGSMRQVFGQDEEEDEMLMNSMILFNCLRSVAIQNLDSLISFFLGTNGVLDFPSLKDMEISWCPNLKTFVRRPPSDRLEALPSPIDEGIHYLFDDKVIFPNLVQLDLESVGSMEEIWHKEIPQESFCKLEIILIKDCQNLANIFPSNMIGTQWFKFQNLKKIRVTECNSLEGSLFKFPREEKGPVCKKLEHELEPTSHIVIGFPNLVEIFIADCEYVIDLLPIATIPTLSKLEKLEIFRCTSMKQVFGKEEAEEEDKIMNSINLPCLRSITIQGLDSLICIFLGIGRAFDFPSLEALDISICPNLVTFIQSHESDKVEHLASHIGTYYFFDDDKVGFPNLQKMELVKLNSLQMIWKNHELPASSDSFSRLKSLIVSDCNNLQHVFPASLARYLVQLEELYVHSSGVEEIVVEYDCSREWSDETTSSQFYFPRLTSLDLYDLLNLRSFFRGSNASTWPALKTLLIWHCDEVRIFTSKFCISNSRQSLFSAEQVIPKLEQLTLVEEDTIMIQNGEFADDIFSGLKTFTLSCFHIEGAAFPSRFLLEKFQRLERLIVFCSSFEEIFPEESLSPQEIISYEQRLAFAAGETSERPFARLTELKLSELCNLKRVLGANTIFAEILRSIQVVEVDECPELISLFPRASASFGNIMKIEVRECEGLKELMSTCGATSLVKLTRMDVYDCGTIEEIVADMEDGGESAEDCGSIIIISFAELKHLGFHSLPSLTCFSSSRKCTFEFPSLEEVVVEACPKMEMFSKGVVAPKLKRVKLQEEDDEEEGEDKKEENEEDKVCWDGDLNTTIQNLFSKGMAELEEDDDEDSDEKGKESEEDENEKEESITD